MSFEDAWSSCRKRRLTAAPLRVTWPQGPAMHHANRCLSAPACVADPQRDVWRGRVRPSGTPTARDENASPSPTAQNVLPTPLEPETTKPKIGWKMENVSRSTIPVRLLDFRGHREVSQRRLDWHGLTPREPVFHARGRNRSPPARAGGTAGRWAIPVSGSPQTVHHQPAQSAIRTNQTLALHAGSG